MISKFRAYISYGYTSQELNDPNLLEEIQETGLGFIDIPELIDFKNGSIKYDSEWYDKDRFDLMQSTGVKDKNNKEIFDGDILYVEFEIDEGVTLKETLKVFFSEEKLAWCLAELQTGEEEYLCDYIDNLSLEVIGNIYEDTELLKVKEDE